MRVLTKYKERTMKVDLYTKIVLTTIGLFLNVTGDSKLTVIKDATAVDRYDYKHYQQHSKTNIEFLSWDVDASEIKPNEVIMEVHGVVCSFCAQGVKKKLRKFKFVDRNRLNKGISMNMKNQRITVAIKSGEKVDVQGLFKAVLSGGYEPIAALISDEDGNIRSVKADA